MRRSTYQPRTLVVARSRNPRLVGCPACLAYALTFDTTGASVKVEVTRTSRTKITSGNGCGPKGFKYKAGPAAGTYLLPVPLTIEVASDETENHDPDGRGHHLRARRQLHDEPLARRAPPG